MTAWAELSPHLDRLLTLPVLDRDRALDEIAANDAALSARLRELLSQRDDASRQGFLSGMAEPQWLAPPALVVGTVLGAWTLHEPIGEGGMGSVWRARRSDGRFEGEAAIKVLKGGAIDATARERFRREGAILARLKHPGIAQLFDAGLTEQGLPYLVLELVHGEPIDRWCDARRLPLTARIELFLQVLEAVAAAHAQLVIHRDLKPSNILVDEHSRVRLLDFGIAQLLPGSDVAQTALTREGAFALTPQYAAPEQAIEAAVLSTATDVYALGVVLHELLTGVHPSGLMGASALAYLRAATEGVEVRASVRVRQASVGRAGPEQRAQARGATPRALERHLHGDLDAIVAKALAKQVERRYTGAGAFAEELQRWQRGEPVLAQRQSRRYRATRFIVRHRWGSAAAVLSLSLLLAGLGATLWQAAEARRERDEARWQAERAFGRSALYSHMLGEMGALDTPLTQREVLDRAAMLVERQFATQPRLAVEMLLPIAGQFHSLGDIGADLKVMNLAARFAAASGEQALIAQVACSTVNTHLALGRPQDAQAALAHARTAMALAPPPVNVQAECLRFEAEWRQHTGRVQEALQLTEQAKALIDKRGDKRWNSYPAILSLLVMLRRESGDVAGAFAAIDQQQALERDAARGSSLGALLSWRARALLLSEGGEVVTAHRELAAAVDRHGIASAPAAVLLTLANLEFRLNDLDGSLRTLDVAERVNRNGGGDFEAPILLLRARTALASGATAQARELMTAARAARNADFRLRGSYTVATVQAELLLAEGDASAARRGAETELRRLTDNALPRHAAIAATATVAARIALTQGDAKAAQAHAHVALDAASRAARDPESSANVGEARLLGAWALQAENRGEEARLLAAQAVSNLERGLGDRHRLVEQAIDVAGAAVPRRTN